MARTRPDSVLYAEFDTPRALIAAIALARAHGWRHMEAYTPYPSLAVEQALALPSSRLPRFILAAGLLGAASAYFLQVWVAAIDYPLDVGATPYHSGPAFIPITFEATVLFAGLASFFGFLATVRLPRLWDRAFEVDGFVSATVHRFWLELRDDEADVVGTERALLDAGARRVEIVGGTV